jgi:hypothetical protein
MATIPLGNFGNVTPGRAPVVSGFEQTGRALTNLGREGAQAAMQLRADETRYQDEERRRQEAQAEAAQRAREAAALHEVEDQLKDLHDDVSMRVMNRTLERDAAEPEFKTRSKEIVDGALSQVRPETREIVGPRLGRTALRLGNGVRVAVERRDRQDVTASIGTSLEYFERLYRDDPVKANEMARATIEQMGPWSDMTPDRVSKLHQTWKERTQGTAARSAVNGALGNPAALDRAEQFIGALPDIDPPTAESQLQRIAVERQRIANDAERKAERAERLRERQLTRAEHAANALQTLADKGTALDPAYVAEQLEATRGTPYQAVVASAAQQAAQNGGQASKSLARQQADLQAIDAHIAANGRNPEWDKRRDQVEKVLRGAQADIHRDGGLAAYAARQTGFQPAKLDFTAGLPGVVEGLQARAQQASEVSLWSGRPESPLYPQEADTLKRNLDALQPKERAQWLASIAGAVGPQAARGLAEQMDPKDKALALAMGYQSAMTTQGRLTSELILKGQQAKADGTSTKGDKAPDVKASAWRAHAAAELDGVFGSRETSGRVTQAAELIMHGIAAEQGGRLSNADMERAVRLAVGGALVEHNGRKIPLPAGLDEDALQKRLRSVTADELAQQAPGGVVRAGGVQVPLADFVAKLPGQQLMPARPGEFAVLVDGRPVVNAQGQPIIVKVR